MMVNNRKTFSINFFSFYRKISYLVFVSILSFSIISCGFFDPSSFADSSSDYKISIRGMFARHHGGLLEYGLIIVNDGIIDATQLDIDLQVSFSDASDVGSIVIRSLHTEILGVGESTEIRGSFGAFDLDPFNIESAVSMRVKSISFYNLNESSTGPLWENVYTGGIEGKVDISRGGSLVTGISF